MATTLELVEILERGLSGGIKTDEQKWQRNYLIEQLNSGRGVIARNDYSVNKIWNPSLIQYCYPSFDQYFQENACVTRFTLPSGFISADDQTIGITYAGSNIQNEPLKGQNFRRISSRTALNDFLRNPSLSPENGHYKGYLVEGNTLTIIAQVKTPCIGGVFQVPTALEDFNIEKSEYPVNIELFQLIQTYLYQQLGVQAATQADTLSDSQTVITPQNLAQMINKRMSR